jgi:excinuclease ABC subunit C
LTVARLFGLRTGKFTSHSSRELYQLLSEIKDRQWEKMLASDYQRQVKLAEMFLRGRKAELVGELEKRMKQAAAEANFELAKLYRDQIRSIKTIADDQVMSLPKSYDQDVVNYVVAGDEIHFQVFNVNRGVVTSRNEFAACSSQLAACSSQILEDFIKQYYLTRSVPEEVIISTEFPELSLVQKYLERLKGSKVRLLVPRQGDKRKLLDLVRENILTKIVSSPEKELQARLSLPILPETIDAFDISNISGQQAVGSCVRFSHGQPDKNLYRKFKIRTIKGPNDYAMMLEVISRRYQHAGWSYPDLILVDGGRGQLNIALKVLAELKLNIPAISLAKREEELYTPQQPKPVRLERSSAALKLLQRIRDEAHRFAIGYHKLLRKKRR